MSRLDNKEEKNYPGNQYRFFQRVCLNDKGELCVDSELKDILLTINDNLVSGATATGTGTQCCPTEEPCKPPTEPCKPKYVCKTYHSQPTRIEYYNSAKPQIPKKSNNCTIISKPPKVIRVDLSSPREKAIACCRGCGGVNSPKRQRCIEKQEKKYIEYAKANAARG